jgi:hypothetical protein
LLRHGRGSPDAAQCAALAAWCAADPGSRDERKRSRGGPGSRSACPGHERDSSGTRGRSNFQTAKTLDTPPPSRGMNCPSCAKTFSAMNHRGRRGMPGARRTRSLACEIKKHTSVVATGSPRTPGIPCAMVLTVSFVLFPVTGLSCHRRRRYPARRTQGADIAIPPTWHQRRDARTTRLRRPRKSSLVCARAIARRARYFRVHRILIPTSVTIASRPSWRDKDGAEDAGVSG